MNPRRHPGSAVLGVGLLLSVILPNGFLANGAARAESRKPTVGSSEPLFDGLGSIQHPVSTTSPLAQRYFEQGLAFTYGFNHDEAERAFQQSAKIDPNLAMAYWGVALVLGPNYNLPGDKERGARAVAALKAAQSHEANATPEERDLIEALAHRYGSDGEPSSERDAAYANAMREVARRYKDEPDVQVLFAEALMDLHPWQLWSADGRPEADTVEIVSVLEGVLKKYPNHIGANHYYIHAVEASRDPGRALPSADRLAGLAPGAGHLVHMPSHIYIRTGRYHDAAGANAKAIKVDTNFLRQTGETGYYPLAYYTHNYDFLCYAQMMEGSGRAALATARELQRHLPLDEIRAMPMAEFLVPTPLFVETRFGMWEEILREPRPPEDLLFVAGSWHYARGIAFAKTGRSADARKESVALGEILRRTSPDRPLGTSNHAKDVLGLAAAVLSGEIAASNGDHREAEAKFAQAVRLQDALTYDEPPDWYYPTRESLGGELVAAGKPKEAEAVYREDLKLDPGNPRSLRGLEQALKSEGKGDEAATTEKLFKAAWRYADAEPSTADSANATPLATR
jgi:tetratricopeptide (TPR) repeat protein